jgi:hypothetical protein
MSRRLAFKALRNGAALGTHELAFAAQGGTLTVGIAIDCVVRLGFVPVFRYRLRGRETWSDGALVSAQADTDNNGTAAFMRARREGDALIVEGSAGPRYRAPDGALVVSHRNKRQLDGPMINPQDGALLRFTVTSKGAAKVADSAGRVRTTDRSGLSGETSLDLWYETDGAWTSLQA